MIDAREWVTHVSPVWRERSNYIAKCNLNVDQLPFKYEQLWLRKLPDALFQVCCIPFFAKGIHLGDIVSLTSEGAVEAIVTPSGHWTLRLLFRSDFTQRDDVIRDLGATGVTHERFTKSLYSLDTTDADHAKNVMTFLDHHMDQGHLGYETGWI
jgi:hypothetical protein